jgi:hypothetical protein
MQRLSRARASPSRIAASRDLQGNGALTMPGPLQAAAWRTIGRLTMMRGRTSLGNVLLVVSFAFVALCFALALVAMFNP